MLWAKWGRDGGGFYPLEAHLIDTAAVAQVLVRRWLPPRLLDRAAAMLAQPADVVERIIVSGAALHDIGKASAVFQGQLLAMHPPDHLSSHIHQLEEQGFEFPEPGSLPSKHDEEAHRWARRHEVAGAVLLHGELDDAGMEGIASLVSGHHGTWDIPDAGGSSSPESKYYRQMCRLPTWQASRRAIVDTVAATTGADASLSIDDPATIPLLTSIVTLADWLASDLAERDPSWPDDDEWGGHWVRRLTDAARSVDDLLGTPPVELDDFEAVFEFPPTRPVQQALVKPGVPGLRIVSVPTGEGKTEAALGHWMRNRDTNQGVFFALPSMATADAMMIRIQHMFRNTNTFGALAHGHAILNEFYDPIDRTVTTNVHDGCQGLSPTDWLTGNRRAVLAPVTIGTADQLILAAIGHRYNTLRLLGAATKTVIFDEVHSYDPYMSRLLERFLTWAGEWNMDVVLLSATLPQDRLRAYVSAYGSDHQVEAVYPSVTAVLPDQPLNQTPVATSPTNDRTLHLRTKVVEDTTQAAVDLVARLRKDHPSAKIGVIVNTVARCQSIAAQLSGRRWRDSKALPPVAGRIDVMHSRFTAAQRAKRIHDVVNLYGQKSSTSPATMVATQVVEQSVDLDFDILVTEIAPATSLVQRAGRLHRHDLTDPGRVRRERPPGCGQPVMHVLVPAVLLDPSPPAWELLPYPAASLLRTWTAGLDSGSRRALKVPDDIQAFVDRSEVTIDELATAGDDHVLDHLGTRVSQLSTADREAVPTPAELRRRPEKLLHYAPAARDRVARPQTRWIDQPSFDILLVNGGKDTWAGQIPHNPTWAQVRELMGCVVSVPFDPTPDAGALQDGSSGDVPEGWRLTPLRAVRILDLQRGDYYMDEDLGLIRNPDA